MPWTESDIKYLHRKALPLPAIPHITQTELNSLANENESLHL